MGAREMFLKEIQSVISGEHRNDSNYCFLLFLYYKLLLWIIINDKEKVLVVWAEKQVNHGISLNLSLVQIKALTVLNAIKAERGEEAAEEKFDAGGDRFVRFKERSHLHNIKMPGDAARTDVEV